MKIGPYHWDVEPDLMTEEEFQYFCEAVEHAKLTRKLYHYTQAMDKLLKAAEEDGVQFIQYEGPFTFSVINTTTFEAAEIPQEQRGED